MIANTKNPPLISEAEAARLTEREEADLARAHAEFGRAKTQGNKEIAKEKIARIDRGRRGRVDSVWRRHALDETIELAESRGEEVNRKPEKGAVDIESRDGLRRMKTLGHITAEHLKVGMIYRAGHEARGADLKAQVLGDSGGGAHDNDAFVARRLERAKLGEFVARVDRAVAMGCITNPAALQMLRHVAGEGGNISDFGKGRGLARHREALILALDAAARVWRDIIAQHVVYEAGLDAAS
jgi:hypothetical protein